MKKNNSFKSVLTPICLSLVSIGALAQENEVIAQPPTETVNITPVVFKNQTSGFQLAGVIYTLIKMKKSDHLPAVVVQGPMGSTKEQTASLYAQLLAEKGFVTMVYDYSYFGSSEGQPRAYEDPTIKATDINSAVAFITKYPNVDKNKIFAVGICGSGVYLPYAVTLAKSSPLKAIAVVNPFEMIHFVAPNGKSEAQLLSEKKLYEEKGIVTRVNPIEEGSEGAEYYYNSKRGAAPNWLPFASWSELSWRKFFPAEEVKKLHTPFLVIAGENAFTRQGAELMYNNAATNSKEFFVVPKARHFDMYDEEAYLSVIIPKIITFFNQYSKQ